MALQAQLKKSAAEYMTPQAQLNTEVAQCMTLQDQLKGTVRRDLRGVKSGIIR
jgi:hypothetical protein